MTSVLVGVTNLTPDAYSIGVLLWSIHFHLYRVGIVLAQDVLHGVDIVLTHIAEAASVVVPIAAEGGVHAMTVVGLIWSRAEPHIVVEFLRHRFGHQVLLAHPVEFPSKSGSTGDSYFQRPSKQTAINEFFQRFHCGAKSIEIIFKTEPSIETENAVVLLHGFHHSAAFAYGASHGFFAPNILARLSCFDSHKGMPVRRSGYVHHIYIRVVDKIAKIVMSVKILAEFGSGEFQGLLQMQLVHIAHRYQATMLVARKVVAAASYATHAYYTLGELIAWSHMLGAAKHLGGHYREECQCAGGFKKISSIACHNYDVFMDFRYLDVFSLC